MIQDICHNRQGVISIIRDGKEEELKEQMLKLLGLYVDKGYYKVSVPREQHYAYYDTNNPNTLKKHSLEAGAQPEVVSVAITDVIDLQKTYALQLLWKRFS